MRRWRQALWALLVVGLGVSLLMTTALAQDDEAYIGYRQRVMQSQGASMGAIGDILKHKLPYNGHIAAHARDIQAMSTLISDAFKKEITAGKTDVKPEIWQEWEKFVAAAKDLERESTALADVAQGGDMEAIAAQVKKVGEACGNCHKPYRKPKEESYKR